LTQTGIEAGCSSPKLIWLEPGRQTPESFRGRLLKDISVTQRGESNTPNAPARDGHRSSGLDVLNIVRRLTEEKRQRAGALQDASRRSRIVVPRASVLDCGGPPPLSPGGFDQPEFTTADAYAFTRELEKLHPATPIVIASRPACAG
jgi:hypothetical protein